MSLLLFLIILTGVFYYRISLTLGSLILLASALLLTQYSVGMWIVLLLLAAVILVLNVPGWRRRWLARPVYERLRKAMPPMSKTEREALEAGTTWWEKDLFSGNPDWGKFASIKPPLLTEAEQTYMDVEVENLCKLIDDWDVQQRQDLSPETWDYLRQHGFFGLIIPEEFGGRDFSPYAQSRVMSKIASRSIRLRKER